MLENFIIAVESVVPIFMIILAGMAARRLNLMTDTELKHANSAVFQVMFPVLMFYNIYSSDFSGVVIPEYIAFCVIMMFAVYFLSVGITLVVEKDNYSRGALIQAMYRSNFVLMGIPIMENLLGKESLGLTSFMVAIIVPIFNVMAVVTLEIFRGGKVKIGSVIIKILKNPMILGAVAGIVTVMLGIKLPIILEKPVSQISGATTPVALLIMGASFRLSSIKENRKNIFFGVLSKLVINPGLAIAIGYALGFRGMPLAILIVMFGAPCAVAGYTMAQQMDSNGELAAGCLIFTSILSCVTICGWIFLLKQIGAI